MSMNFEKRQQQQQARRDIVYDDSVEDMGINLYQNKKHLI